MEALMTPSRSTAALGRGDAALHEFSVEASRRLRADGRCGFFALQDAFKHLVFGTDFLHSTALAELGRIAENTRHESARWEPDHILIAGDLAWQLRIGLYARASDFVYTLPFDLMVAVIDPRGLRVARPSLPEGMVNEVFDPAIRLPTLRYETVPGGEVFVVDGSRELLDIQVERPVLVVKLNTSVRDALQWAFDRQTGSAVQAIAADPLDSELVSTLRALASMQRGASVEPVRALTCHRRHFVRWAAIQCLARLAPELAVDALRAAAVDSHPHIAQAAAHALSRLGQKAMAA
jgi:hypothetical protein